MVSRRNFFTITLIMLVVLFMFQVPEIIKDRVNHYEQNEYVEEATNRFQKDSVVKTTQKAAGENNRFVVYIGNTEDRKCGSTVKEWCQYTKRYASVYSSLGEYRYDEDKKPEAVLIDTAYLDMEKDLDQLTALTDEEVNLIFCNLPGVKQLSRNENVKFRSLLGIRFVRQEKVTVEGIRLSKGFLLGGVKEYKLTEDMDKEQQDLNLEIPWYSVTSRTRIYMTGMIDQQGDGVSEAEQQMEPGVYNAHLPALIWRNNVNGANVFVVNGDYLDDHTGLGILSAMFTQAKEYDVYPVVNAQNFVVLNFPDLASENELTMLKMYSQNLKSVYRDIVWPGLVSVAQQNGLRMTCMFMPQMDYTDHVDPEDELLVYYMKRIQEQGAEAGLSGTYGEGVSLEEKTKQDLAFMRGVIPDYTILSFYQGNLTEDGLKQVFEKNDMLSRVHTIYRDYDEEEPLLSYYSANVLSQRVTNDGYSHTFSENLRMNSIETALAYTGIGVDVNPVAYPSGIEDSWEKLSEKFASNTGTYWKNYRAFAQTTLAQSDLRVRRFLALDYHASRTGNQVFLSIENFDTEAYFLFRTHGEEIVSVEGAEFEQVEEDTYLISANSSAVSVYLDQEEENYYKYSGGED